MENLENNSKTPLTNHLDKVIKKERQKRNQRILILLLFGLTLGGSIAVFTTEWDVFDMKIISHTDSDQRYSNIEDSLRAELAARYSLPPPEEDYTKTMESVDEFEEVNQEFTISPSEEPEDVSVEPITVEEERKTNTIPNIFFRVKGSQLEGEKLTFSIEGYRPDIIYTMQFGDGRQKRVGREVVFTYERSGIFQPTLIASNASGATRRSTRTIVISKKENIKPAEKNLLVSRDSAPENKSATTEKVESRNIAEQESTTPEIPKEDIVENDPAEENKLDETAEQAPVRRALKFAEEMPSFPGGTAAMYKYLNGKLNYPTLAFDNQIEGNVYLQFVVHPDGSRSKFHILKGIGYGCDEEVIRVVKQMPKWVPGKHNGSIVPVVYTLKVNFKFK